MRWEDSESVRARRPEDAGELDVEALARAGRRLRMLLAEDDDDVRWSLTTLFLNGGHDVHAVRDGAQMLDELAAVILGKPGKFAPDLIVTDVRMPGFSALNIVAGLRDAGWTTPVFVISAYGDEQLRGRIQRLGDARYFDKPLDLDALEAAVASVAVGLRPAGSAGRTHQQ